MEMSNRKILLLSSSKIHGSEFLEYIISTIDDFLKKYNVRNLVFIPYALKNYDEYTNKVKSAFKKFNVDCVVSGIHEKSDPVDTVKEADGIFIGGGNTFLLLKTLYDLKLVDVIRDRVLKDGMVYIGSSAGTNIATPTINTTNDMPIVYPPTFDALNLINFNINPHYLDPDPNSTHKGETREERIKQFHEIEGSRPVLGLREGSYLIIEGDSIILKGKPAVLFLPHYSAMTNGFCLFSTVLFSIHWVVGSAPLEEILFDVLMFFFHPYDPCWCLLGHYYRNGFVQHVDIPFVL